MKNIFSEDDLVDEKYLADYLGITERALQAWRYRGKGPKYIKISARMLRYRIKDINDFLEKKAKQTKLKEKKRD